MRLLARSMKLTGIRVALPGLALALVLALAPAIAFAQSTVEPATPAKVMLLGLFHFDNPGMDAVRYEPLDVMQPQPQACLAGLSERLARFAPTREFHGADASADWWHRNLRMYALVQQHAAPGERVLVIAGSGHTAILRDLLRADADRVEVDVLPYL
jgi:hypothetical protein